MSLLNEIIINFPEWQLKVFDDGTTMHSRRFSGNTHERLKDNFHGALNSFIEEDKTIVVSCFDTYTSIAIFNK